MGVDTSASLKFSIVDVVDSEGGSKIVAESIGKLEFAAFEICFFGFAFALFLRLA